MNYKWEDIMASLYVGRKVCGKVKIKPPFGIFIELENGDIEVPLALLELIRISDTPQIADDFHREVPINENICAIILGVDNRSGIRLSTRKSDFQRFGFTDGL
jgi:predicted RNA-binding protein with RPS1 domain